MGAEDLASQIEAAGEGDAQIGTQLEVRLLDGGKRVMQLQIKQRRTRNSDRSCLPSALA